MKEISEKERRLDLFFSCTKRERAAFEAGIKLGGIFHQFVGLPLSSSNKEAVEKVIEESVKIQPYVKSVKVKIKGENLKPKEDEFDYTTLKGEEIYLELRVNYKDVEVVAVMEYIEEENYPLMYIKEIKEGID